MQVIDSMNDKQPLLTIAIPTYNRSAFLGLCLRRIGEELDSLTADQRNWVKVYVSNNASTDNTIEVMSQFQFIGAGGFEAVHNTENIGGERNVAQCYISATTPYVWVLGDDDVILPGGLGKVLDALLQNDVDILYLNNYWFKDDYSENRIRRENHGISICRDALEFARKTNVMVTFISGLIVRSGINLNKYASAVDGSNLPQMGWVLPLLRDGKCFVVIEDWVVAAKGANSGGYELVKVFGSNLKKITENILKDKPEIAEAIQNGTIVNFFPGFIMAFRKGSSQFADKEMAVGLQEAFSDNWRYYVFLVPLIGMPLYLSKYYYYLVRLLAKLVGSLLI